MKMTSNQQRQTLKVIVLSRNCFLYSFYTCPVERLPDFLPKTCVLLVTCRLTLRTYINDVLFWGVIFDPFPYLQWAFTSNIQFFWVMLDPSIYSKIGHHLLFSLSYLYYNLSCIFVLPFVCLRVTDK